MGKSSNGSPPKRRTVLTVPEMDWVVPVLQQWVEEVRPLFSPGNLPVLWMTERRGRLSRRAINEAFEEARDAAGLDPVLDLHCLRHLYHAPDRVRLPYGGSRARVISCMLASVPGLEAGAAQRVLAAARADRGRALREVDAVLKEHPGALVTVPAGYPLALVRLAHSRRHRQPETR